MHVRPSRLLSPAGLAVGLLSPALSPSIAAAASVDLGYLTQGYAYYQETVPGPGFGDAAAIGGDLAAIAITSPDTSSGGASEAILTSGEIKVSAAGQATPPDSIGNEAGAGGAAAALFDVLTFDQAATVSYEIALDGRVELFGAGSQARVESYVQFRDVTGTLAPEIYQFNPLTELYQLHPDLPYPFAGSSYGAYLYGGESFYAGTPGPDAEVFEDMDGAELEIDKSHGASFQVEAGRQYLVWMSQAAFVSSVNSTTVSTADLSHTATFRFTDLGGATFTSASGLFLTAAPGGETPGGEEPPAPVPLPAGALLLAGALGLLAVARRPAS